MTPVIVLTNQKGGVAKTTTADALVEWLRERGCKVLAVDVDAQGSLGELQERYAVKGTPVTSSFLKGEGVAVGPDGQAVVPGDPTLSMIESFPRNDGTPIDVYTLRDEIDRAVEEHGFDAVVIDTPPSVDLLSISALAAATHVIVPTTADRFGVSALKMDLDFFSQLQEEIELRWMENPAVLITMYKSLTRNAIAYAEQITDELPKFGMKVFRRRIPLSTKINEAQTQGRSIFSGNVLSGAAYEYHKAFELIPEFCGIEMPSAGRE